MNRTKPGDLSATCMLTGFLAGLLVTVIIYILVFQTWNEKFTFDLLLQMHQNHPLLYITDALSFAGLLTGYLVSLKFNHLLDRIRKKEVVESSINQFLQSTIQNLTKGNLNVSMIHEEIDPEILLSLSNLQSRLKANRQAELSARETDEQRNWTSQGLAEFGDILRTNSSDRDKLGYAVISNLARYLDINQGGFFIINDTNGERTLEMIACHAYDRKKFPDKRIRWGEGLIGAAAIEKKSYYTDKIPDGYLSITSGLGRANPRHLLIVPMILNDEVFGVFELASFRKFEDFQIQLVERVAENTATTLNTLYNNRRTEQLLKETQEQAAQLVMQEEKVRQNINELQQTQAEAARQSEQFVSFTNTVNHTLIRAEYDIGGKLIYANTRFLKKLGYSGNREVEGKHVSLFIHEADREWFSGIWKRLSDGGEHYEGFMRHVTKMGQDLWTMATYTCVRKDDGSIDKVLCLAFDSSGQREESLAYEGELNATNKLSPKAEFSPDGRLIGCNELFESTLKYTSKEINENNIFDFIARSEQERFNEIWEQVVSGTVFQGQIYLMGKYEEEIWFRAVFTALIDLYGEVSKILFLGFEITKEKELEELMRSQSEKLQEKEEEVRIQNLDLKRQIAALEKTHTEEKSAFQKERTSYADMIEQLPQPIISINNQGFILVYNKAAGDFCKIPEKKILNKQIGTLFTGNQGDPAVQAFTDPGKPFVEVAMKKVSLSISGLADKEAVISIIKTESVPERIYTLVVHI